MTNPVASLDALTEQQRALYRELDAGFETRPDLLLWLHEAAVRSLGQLPDDWFENIVADRHRVAALLADKRKRDAMTPHAPDERLAAFERECIADDVLLEACRKAMALLNKQANDYAESDEQPDPTVQQYLAMRPALDDLVERQRSLLADVLGRGDRGPTGLEARRELSTWGRELVRATNGADGGLARTVAWDLYPRRVLLGEPSSPSLHLYLAGELFPVLNRAIRREVQAAREVAAEERANHGSMEVA